VVAELLQADALIDDTDTSRLDDGDPQNRDEEDQQE